MCSPDVTATVYEQLARRRLGRRALVTAGLVTAATAGMVGAVGSPRRAVAHPAGTVWDLTHVVDEHFPVWPGSRRFAMRTVADNKNNDTGSLGSLLPQSIFYVNELSYDEHTGTHVDAPAHADPDGITVERIPVENLTAPLVVIDIAARAASDHDALLSTADIDQWERLHGRIPERAFVALHSGWQSRLSEPGAFTNQDATGVQHTPGFAREAVERLVHERSVVGIGTDTLSIDAGRDTSYSAHLAALGSGIYAVEVLADLHAVPASGATVFVGAPTHAGGSGGPARVLAFSS
ncbi:cyclase family protein [Rhodococcus sp. HNM0569]|uniref:cyclase family protein n=1 Tax=Rhodococcus sp. HNM0569 TaxID=2716340 RepID=UPI00146C9FDF|nr:cyclase family protein [Rhodococcus sp. HNM0569]NLU82716.1 cyclase family protein [Rhodococcus sp. HNM0569]